MDGEADRLERAEIVKREETIGLLIEALQAEISVIGEKNVALLTAVEELCSSLHGMSVILCKSAKDRTAMAVTLHQVCELCRNHNLHFSQFREMLALMREQGVRRDNVIKNTGRHLFAFDEDQVMCHLPSLLRPPGGTYGKNDT
eukprot:gene6687-7548_t